MSYHFKAPIDLFDRHLYEKAALVIHTLRHTLGDTAFWVGVRLYLERSGFPSVDVRVLADGSYCDPLIAVIGRA